MSRRRQSSQRRRRRVRGVPGARRGSPGVDLLALYGHLSPWSVVPQAKLLLLGLGSTPSGSFSRSSSGTAEQSTTLLDAWRETFSTTPTGGGSSAPFPGVDLSTPGSTSQSPTPSPSPEPEFPAPQSPSLPQLSPNRRYTNLD